MEKSLALVEIEDLKEKVKCANFISLSIDELSTIFNSS